VVSISDLVATAFARYGGGFVTYGAAAILLSAIPGAAVAVARGSDARYAITAGALALGASLAYMVLEGLIVADAGRRIRSRAAAIALTAPVAAVPIGVVIAVLGLASLLLLPFIATACALAAVAAGAGDAAGFGALRRGATLAWSSFRRSAALAAILEVLGVLLWLGLYIAFSPLAEGPRVVVAMVVWGAVFGPISALVFRAHYGALTGRLVLAPRPGEPGVEAGP
jgi:hypothetical protein